MEHRRCGTLPGIFPVSGTSLGRAPEIDLAFILSPIRSGSTLLRAILDSNPEVCAPHELHLGDVKVECQSPYAQKAMGALGLDDEQLATLFCNHLYWLILQGTGKRLLVDKSPTNLLIWPKLISRWPAARYILLKRDPAAIARSVLGMGDGRLPEQAVDHVVRSVNLLAEVEAALPDALVVHYERLVDDPAGEVTRVCSHLGVDYRPSMLEYGGGASGPFVYGLGDWSDKIRSGTIQPYRTDRLDTRDWPALADACRRWGYPE
jgi:hypothetical protein